MKFSEDIRDGANPDALAQFMDALFGTVDFTPGQSVAVRGLGEKGTLGEGAFREMKWVQPTPEGWVAAAQHAARWNGIGAGAFVIPAIMRAGSFERQKQAEVDVEAFTCVCLDLDNPDTAEDSRDRLEGALGIPSMVVESSPGKIHLYWLLHEPETDTQRVARLRHLLALKVGGDPCLLRVPQVMRLPGTIHGKNNGHFVVALLECMPGRRYSLEALEDAVEALHPFPWHDADGLAKALGGHGGGKGALDLLSAAGGSDARELLGKALREGGVDGITRHDGGTKVIGHHIRQVRNGDIATLEEARDLCEGWMLTQMDPPWPEEKFRTEWDALVAKDAKTHGPMVPAVALFGSGVVHAPAAPPAPAVGAVEALPPNDLRAWATRRWVGPEQPPARKWLVEGLIRTGAAHILASEGGVGKTFALLDLCLGVAEGQQGSDWLGQAIDPENSGGTAVLLTAEDDQDELRIRLHAMDGVGRRFRVKDRCIVLPLVQAGGVFQLVETGPGGVAQPTAAWRRMMDALVALPDLQLVCIDTLAATLHGEENVSIVIQQYVTALNLLRERRPAVATVVTHHVRKQSSKDQPIQSAADMRQAIRGSNALMGAVRMAIGIWAPPDAKDRLARMSLPPRDGGLFHMAVVKANNPEAMEGTRTLVRAGHGGLVDATEREAAANGAEGERRAWVVAVVERAARDGRPYVATGKGGLAGDRREQLPDALRTINEKAIRASIKGLLDAGKLVQCKITKGGASSYLDVPGGPLAKPDPVTGYQLQTGGDVLDWDGWTFDARAGEVFQPSHPG